MRQRYHALGQVHGVICGPNVGLAAPNLKFPPKTVAELKARPIMAGTYVITMPAKGSTLESTSEKLTGASIWLWKVLRVLEPGSALPPNTRQAKTTSERTYESQLYIPVEAPLTATSSFRPLWDKLSELSFLRTLGELRRGPDADRATAAEKMMHVPLVAMLRIDNILCGGFTLTNTQRLPVVVHTYLKTLVFDDTPLSRLTGLAAQQ